VLENAPSNDDRLISATSAVDVSDATETFELELANDARNAATNESSNEFDSSCDCCCCDGGGGGGMLALSTSLLVDATVADGAEEVLALVVVVADAADAPLLLDTAPTA
jgi:hypothetical protein